MTITFLFVALFVLMFIGIPVAISLGLSGAMTILFFSNDSVRSLAIKLFETSEHYTLLAIPFFLLSGAFMTSGGVARRLIDFANACVGHIKGGLAIAAILACMLFAALSGSSPATVAAVGSIVIAGMVRSGYKQDFAAGIVCNAGTLGILIPPSIVMVVYATATETSVGKLFMAGVVPGLLLGLVLMITIYIMARVKDMPSLPRASFKEIMVAGRRAGWGLMLIVLSLTVSCRYIWWRYTSTLNWNDPVSLVCGIILLFAETYAWVVLVLGYFQVVWPLNRQPVPLPEDMDLWPTVDIFVPTYNEDLNVVKNTIYASQGIDWPKDKLNIWILDDGGREAFRQFAKDVGVHYIARTSHEHAKAGNINNALKYAKGEFVSIFDCVQSRQIEKWRVTPAKWRR